MFAAKGRERSRPFVFLMRPVCTMAKLLSSVDRDDTGYSGVEATLSLSISGSLSNCYVLARMVTVETPVEAACYGACSRYCFGPLCRPGCN